ncbi:MAG: ABC-F family ATP-binding cassette domain-containing protein [Chloroflexota bacterium]|nr:ABC-F family ATP-binding cassette domain-containing protein [Chloroflexota bacterium]
MSKIIVSLKQVVYRHGGTSVLTGVDWELQAGQKIGLVGSNGAGKSTLLRLIVGELQPETGELTRSRRLRLGYLAQEPQLLLEHTVWEEVLGADTRIRRLQSRLRCLEVQMGDLALIDDPQAFDRVLKSHARAQADFEAADGYRYESRVAQALQTVGFDECAWGLSVATLSGGERKMVGLAKLLVTQPELLLLDEPDNHLDLAGKARLEAFIRDYAGSIVIVSHDRYLLDEVATQIAAVERGRLTCYPGNYSAYSTTRQLKLLRQQQQYMAQQKEIARIEAAIKRFQHWAHLVVDERHIRQARARQKMLERMDKIEQPQLERAQMGLVLNGWRGSQDVLRITDLSKVFNDEHGEHIILLGLELLIRRGERVGLLGANGVGKSVLYRCILGQEPLTNGVIKIGPSVRVGYYAQHHETLDPDRTLIEEIWDARSMSEAAAVNVLLRFLFPYVRARESVATLSGGERSRLQLAKLMLSDANFLLLDEPTNNLDLDSREILEQALDDFEGTVFVISHDRYFLNRTVSRIVELEEGALTSYVGDYTYYAERKGLGSHKPYVQIYNGGK